MWNLKQSLFLFVIIINIVEVIYCIRSSYIRPNNKHSGISVCELQPNSTLFSIDCSFHCFPSTPRLLGQGFSFRLAHACKRLQTEAKHLVTSICDLIFGNILYTIKWCWVFWWTSFGIYDSVHSNFKEKLGESELFIGFFTFLFFVYYQVIKSSNSSVLVYVNCDWTFHEILVWAYFYDNEYMF